MTWAPRGSAMNEEIGKIGTRAVSRGSLPASPTPAVKSVPAIQCVCVRVCMLQSGVYLKNTVASFQGSDMLEERPGEEGLKEVDEKKPSMPTAWLFIQYLSGVGWRGLGQGCLPSARGSRNRQAAEGFPTPSAVLSRANSSSQHWGRQCSCISARSLIPQNLQSAAGGDPTMGYLLKHCIKKSI